MIITGVSYQDLEWALVQVNKKYEHNIQWNQPPKALSRSGTRWRLTLRCVSSKGPGHSVGRFKQYLTGKPARRFASACWHVHGHFFDALLPPYPPELHAVRTSTTIWARGHIIHPGDDWEDYNVGSQMLRVYASESCECGV